MKYIAIILYCFVGALDIYGAVNAFEHQHYFIFGLDIMVAVWMVANIFKWTLG